MEMRAGPCSSDRNVLNARPPCPAAKETQCAAEKELCAFIILLAFSSLCAPNEESPGPLGPFGAAGAEKCRNWPLTRKSALKARPRPMEHGPARTSTQAPRIFVWGDVVTLACTLIWAFM